MTGAILVRGGRVLDPDGELHTPRVADVFLENGRIAAVGDGAAERAALRPGARLVDAAGLLVVPGFVNAHYHSHDVLLRGLFEQLPLEVWGLFSFPQNYARRSEVAEADPGLLAGGSGRGQRNASGARRVTRYSMGPNRKCLDQSRYLSGAPLRDSPLRGRVNTI